MSRDGDRGEERPFGESGVCGILLEKDFAAHAVEFRVEPALSTAFEILERMIEGGERGRRLAISRFRFRQSSPDQRLKRPDIIPLKQGGGPPEIRETDIRDAGAQFHPSFQECAESNPQGDAMLIRARRGVEDAGWPRKPMTLVAEFRSVSVVYPPE